MIYSKGISGLSTNEGLVLAEITSTEEEKKSVEKIQYWDIVTQNVFVSAYLERETIMEDIPLQTIDDLMPAREILLGVDIPVGQTLKIVLTPQVTGTQGTLHGLVYYTIE